MADVNGFGTTDILTGRGLGLGGFGGYNYGSDQYAGPTANALRIDSGNKAAAAGLENLLDQNQFTTTNKNVSDCCNRATDLQTNGEFRTADRLRDLEREMNSNARAADKCCCDTQKAIADAAAAALCCCNAQLEACKNTNSILAAVADGKATSLAAEARAVDRQLNFTNAELVSLRTQVACGCNCPS